MTLLDALSLAYVPLKEVSPFTKAVYSFLNNECIPSQDEFDEWVFDCKVCSSSLCKESAVVNWKTHLCLALFCDLTKLNRTNFEKRILSSESQVSDETDQYIRAIIALNHVLSGLPIPSIGVNLLESGAALISISDFCPWLSLPFTPKHFELGIFLSLLSLICDKQTELRESILKMAHWQINALDYQCKPQSGLFVRETEHNTLHHLCVSYLLFRCAALFDPNSLFIQVSKSSLNEITKHLKENESSIDILWLLVDKWLNKYTSVQGKEVFLQEDIYDPSTALVGFRKWDQQVVCTLHGVQTGLGTFSQGDVAVITYGPQYYPLNDCNRFGIQGNALTDKGIRRSQIDLGKHSFRIQGCVRLLDEPSIDTSPLGKFRGIWLDIIQEFNDALLSIKTSFLSLEKLEGVAFTFFVKAPRYSINSRSYSKGKLEKYAGANTPICFEGATGCIYLNALQYESKIEVIPLAGEKDFWGADFLVAYPINEQQKQIEWQIQTQEVTYCPEIAT